MLMLTVGAPEPCFVCSNALTGIILSTTNFQAADWFLWLSSKAALRIVSKTLADLGELSILALYSSIIALSPLGRPRVPLFLDFLATISPFLGLPRPLVLISLISVSAMFTLSVIRTWFKLSTIEYLCKLT